MIKEIVEYSFSESNTKTFVLIPGYSGGLEAGVLRELKEYFLTQGEVNVFGIVVAYQEDTLDIFEKSQRRILSSLEEIKFKTPNADIIVIGKSLGGCLVLFNNKKLPIDKIILLGPSIVLGRPQRISLLKNRSSIIPDYKKEWQEILEALSVPTLILSGSADNLADNKFLYQVSTLNKNIQLTIIENANHDLEDTDTEERVINHYFDLIKKFSGI